MLYLAWNTRPDISFDVHQCLQLTHNTKASNEADMKRIWWSIQGTMYKGLVFKPSKKMVVDFYDDEDFAGLWWHDNTLDNIYYISRT